MDRLGYSALAIGGIWALMPATRLLVTPGWALLADRYRMGTRILQGASLGTVLAVTAMATGLLPAWGLAVCMVLFAAMRAPMGPILDALTVRSLEDAGQPTSRYGRIRLWGSVAFLVCAGTGAVLADQVAWAPAPLALGAVVWGLGFLITLLLPRSGAVEPVRLRPALRTLGQRPGMPLLIGALALHGLGLNAYDAWYAVHMEHLGLSSVWTGAALACGLVIEIGVMAQGVRLLNARDPAQLVLLGLGTGAVRWALTAWLTDPVWLTALQLLHGVVYAVFWIGVVELFRQVAPREIRASAQAVIIMACYGVGPLLGAGVASAVVDDHGTQALYGVAAGASALATLATAVAWRRLRRGG
jgi:PPP family 3-phenylpropionic acid transporter